MIFANGRAFNCSFFGVSTVGNMHIVVNDSTVVEIADFFSRKENIEKIRYEDSGKEFEYTGFIELVGIAVQDDGIRVTLRQKYASEV